MNSIIGALDYKMQHPMKDPDRVKQVHEKIQELLEHERPNPDNFRGIIPDAEIDDDIKKVADLEKKWSAQNSAEFEEMKMKSDIAERVVYKMLGIAIKEKAVTLPVSKADDFLRGIDVLIESKDTADTQDIEHLGIGIDVALISEQSMSEATEKKEKKVRQILKSGKLNEARYVAGDSYKGRIQKLPYIILSVTPTHVEDLFTGVLKTTTNQREESHILKYSIAYQVLRQLHTYPHIAQANGNGELAYEYVVANNFANDLFGYLIEEMEKDATLKSKVMADLGVMEIQRFCDDLQKQLT